MGVPQGALEETRTITITQMDRERAEPLLEKSYALNVSPVYCLSAKNAEGPVDPKGVQFEKPVLVGSKYNLEDEYSILKESNLRAYYYNYKANNWEIIPESYVDWENDTVYFFTKHFSMFSVQASVAAPVSPEQISNMGISPGQSYYQNNQVSISYGGGTASVTAKDFVLPGRGGLDLTISRTYDSGLAQSDWGIDEENIFQADCGFIDFGNAYFSAIANLISAQLDRYLSEPGGSCGFGRGWRMNFVWVEKNENGQFLHLPGGSMKKINCTMDGPGWGGQGHGVFECHAGEHFILEQTQEFVENINSNTNIKTGENWRTTGYTLITKDGTKYLMEGSGKLTKIVNRLGTSEINFYYTYTEEELGYNPITSRKRWEKDARGFVTEYQYDAIDRSGLRSDNPVRQVIFKDGARTTTVIDPMDNRTDYVYDSFEHLVEVVKFKKRSGAPYAYSRVRVRYDGSGNIHEIISPEGCENPAEEFKYKTIYLYDEINRLSKIIYPDDTEDQSDNPFKYYSYNDVTNEVTVTDENLNDTLIKKDQVDRIIEQIAGWRTESQVTTKFTYDSLGNKTSETDGKGNITTYAYDELNRLVRP